MPPWGGLFKSPLRHQFDVSGHRKPSNPRFGVFAFLNRGWYPVLGLRVRCRMGSPEVLLTTWMSRVVFGAVVAGLVFG